MSLNEQYYLVMVVGALVSFALVLGYESFAEWRDKNKNKRH